MPTEVCQFERDYASPVKTGADLLRIVMAETSNIESSFDQADSSSRGLLALAQNEAVVRDWRMEQLNLRARGRFNAYRETVIAQENRPDIVVSSSAADVQAAIEVKNANTGWTTKELAATLRKQLASDYLRPQNRRHRILVVSLHTNRKWRNSSQVWDFGQLMQHLKQIASTVIDNETGSIDIRVFGIDATDRI